MASQNVTRQRTRSVEVTETAGAVPVEIRNLAKEVFVQNNAANEAKGLHDKARKSLLGKMKDTAIKAFTFQFTGKDGKRLSVDVKIATPEVNYIDVETLRKLVTPEQFIKIVTASKAAVEAEVGSVIATQASRTKAGTENVSVKAAR